MCLSCVFVLCVCVVCCVVCLCCVCVLCVCVLCDILCCDFRMLWIKGIKLRVARLSLSSLFHRCVLARIGIKTARSKNGCPAK